MTRSITSIFAVFMLLLLAQGSPAQDLSPAGGLRLQEGIYAGLQAGDLLTTRLAESRGAVEMNPLMQHGWPARIALKAGITGGMLLMVEKSRKDHPRLMKWTLVAANITYGVVLTNNYIQYVRMGRLASVRR
jgi:hypothetical protein